MRNSPQAITPIDADSDGLVDLAVPCRSADAVVILVNRPPGPPLLRRLRASASATCRAPRRRATSTATGTWTWPWPTACGNSVSLLAGDGLGGLSATPRSRPRGGGRDRRRLQPGRHARPRRERAERGDSLGRDLLRHRAAAPSRRSRSCRSARLPPDDLVAADFDRDGDLDLAVCNKVSAGQRADPAQQRPRRFALRLASAWATSRPRSWPPTSTVTATSTSPWPTTTPTT